MRPTWPKSGLDVLVVEKNDYIGGAAVSRELHEGWLYSNCSYVCSLLRQSIHRDLDLTRHGLMIVPYSGTTNFARTGDYIAEYGDHDMQYREIKRHSLRDADAMHRYETDLMRYAKLIRHFLLRTPADPTSLKPRDLGEMMFMAKKFAGMGEEQVYEFIRFMTMSAGDFPRRIFRERPGQNPVRHQQHHRHRTGCVFPGHGLCAAAPRDGRCGRRRRGLGPGPRRHGRYLQCHRRSPAGTRWRDPHQRPGGTDYRQE